MTPEAIFVFFGLPIMVGAVGLAALGLFIWSDNRDLRARAEAKRLEG